jgi:hypothetical protein
MFHHDTESRLLLARERADLLASEMRAGAGTATLGEARRRAGAALLAVVDAPRGADGQRRSVSPLHSYSR